MSVPYCSKRHTKWRWPKQKAYNSHVKSLLSKYINAGVLPLTCWKFKIDEIWSNNRPSVFLDMKFHRRFKMRRCQILLILWRWLLIGYQKGVRYCLNKCIVLSLSTHMNIFCFLYKVLHFINMSLRIVNIQFKLREDLWLIK